MLHEKITERIISAYYKVYNTLGYGFLEKVYEKDPEFKRKIFHNHLKKNLGQSK